jgi:hypothetical protein
VEWIENNRARPSPPFHSAIAHGLLSSARQSHVIQLEETLHSSRWCIAKSVRLFEMIGTSRDMIGPTRKERP